MTQDRLSAPETIRTGGFSGGVHVAPTRPAQGGGLQELGAALSRLNGATQRKVAQDYADIDRLAEEAAAEAQATGQSADGFLQATAGNPRYDRLRRNPGMFMARMDVLAGRRAAEQEHLRMVEEGVDITSPAAVQQWRAENTQESQSRFYNRGFNERRGSLDRELFARQQAAALEQIEDGRMTMAAEQYTAFMEEGLSPVEAAERLGGFLVDDLGFSRSETNGVRMAILRTLAASNQLEAFEALADTPRDTANGIGPMAEDLRYSADIERMRTVLQNNARTAANRGLAENAERFETGILNGTIRSEEAIDAALEAGQIDQGQRNTLVRALRGQLDRELREAERISDQANREIWEWNRRATMHDAIRSGAGGMFAFSASADSPDQLVQPSRAELARNLDLVAGQIAQERGTSPVLEAARLSAQNNLPSASLSMALDGYRSLSTAEIMEGEVPDNVLQALQLASVVGPEIVDINAGGPEADELRQVIHLQRQTGVEPLEAIRRVRSHSRFPVTFDARNNPSRIVGRIIGDSNPDNDRPANLQYRMELQERYEVYVSSMGFDGAEEAIREEHANSVELWGHRIRPLPGLDRDTMRAASRAFLLEAKEATGARVGQLDLVYDQERSALYVMHEGEPVVSEGRPLILTPRTAVAHLRAEAEANSMTPEEAEEAARDRRERVAEAQSRAFASYRPQPF